VPVEARREQREPYAGGEANDDPREETASDTVDERNKDDTER